ncbi:MAG: hypothetical protein MRY79_08610 [Alphaproteobacteria bacterium]|nr:hypothetical protein [Alphaproteobacteria bacterium]
MVGSINNAFPQQIPTTNKFQPGVTEDKNQPQSKAVNGQESAQIGQVNNTEPTQAQNVGKTLPASSENSITTRSDERGQNLDIFA